MLCNPLAESPDQFRNGKEDGMVYSKVEPSVLLGMGGCIVYTTNGNCAGTLAMRSDKTYRG